MGHACPFDFNINYEPVASIERMRVGTPPVLQMAALEAALDVWDDVSMHDIREKSIELSELFIVEVEKRCPTLTLISPRDSEKRGSQVSFFNDSGYEIIQALIARGIIGDFRAPDVLHFGFTPLYVSEDDVMKSVDMIEGIIKGKVWGQDQFKRRGAVT